MTKIASISLLKNIFTFKNILWLTYGAILSVLIPHTQWAFSLWEPTQTQWASWVAAIAFEAMIFLITHALVEHIAKRKPSTFNIVNTSLPVGMKWWPMFKYRWVNFYSLLILVAAIISTIANIAHAVEFGTEPKIVSAWGLPYGFMVTVFSGILPFVSFLFAFVITVYDESKATVDPAIAELKEKLKEADKKHKEELKSVEQQRHDALEKFARAEHARLDALRKVNDAEIQFQTMTRFFRLVFEKDGDIQSRIRELAISYPNLSQNRIAGLLGCSVSTVNTVFQRMENEKV